MINEKDYLITEIAKTIAEDFGTRGVEQYFPLAEKIYNTIDAYAAKVSKKIAT